MMWGKCAFLKKTKKKTLLMGGKGSTSKNECRTTPIVHLKHGFIGACL